MLLLNAIDPISLAEPLYTEIVPYLVYVAMYLSDIL